MAITFGSNLIHFNPDLALVDSEQTFGGFKNHIQNIVGFDGLVDSYIDNSANYFNDDLWGKFKPYGTFIYAVNGNDLLVKTDQEVIDEGLVLGTDYFEVTDEDDNTINVVVDGVGVSPAYFVYTGNTDYLNVGPNVWDSTQVNVYETFTDSEGVSKARAKYWKNLSSITGGGTQGIVDLTITGAALDAPSSLSESSTTTLDQVVLGDISGDAENGYTIEFPTHLDIKNAFSGLGGTLSELIDSYWPELETSTDNDATIGWYDSGNGFFQIKLNKDADIVVNGITSNSNALINGQLTVTPSSVTNFQVLAGAVNIGNAVSVASVQPEFDIYSEVINFHNLDVSGGGTILSVSGPDNELTAITGASIVDGVYADLVETIEGTPNQITVTGGAVTGDPDQFEGDVVVSLADQLILGNVDGGSVTVGGAVADGGYEVGITVHGNAQITGTLQVDGGIVNTTSSEVSFEDSLLSLNVARDEDGNIEVTGINTLGTEAGIEAFFGASAGNSSTLHHSRPYLYYSYGGGEPVPGQAGSFYGKWVLANYYEEDNGVWTPVQGTILTTVDLNLVDLSVDDTDLHEPVVGDDNLKHLVSAYQLTNFTNSTQSGQSVDRRFGRVAVTEYTYAAGDAGAQITVQHGLNSDHVMAFGVVVTNGAGTTLPIPGHVITPKSLPGGTPNERYLKIAGTVNGDVIKFVFIG